MDGLELGAVVSARAGCGGPVGAERVGRAIPVVVVGGKDQVGRLLLLMLVLSSGLHCYVQFLVVL